MWKHLTDVKKTANISDETAVEKQRISLVPWMACNECAIIGGRMFLFVDLSETFVLDICSDTNCVAVGETMHA